LIELLVVISIIALLISILVPSLSEAKWQAKVTQCAANLHSCGVGVGTYSSTYIMDEPFIFEHGKADSPAETPDPTLPAPGNPAMAMANPKAAMLIHDPNVFFCPCADYYTPDKYTIWPISFQHDAWGSYFWVYPHLLPEDDPYHPYRSGVYSHDNERLYIGKNSKDVVMYDCDVGLYVHTNVLLLNGAVERLGTRWPPIDYYLYGGPPWYTN